MPLKVECEICGAKYRVGDERGGTVIPCKSCGADIDVPDAGYAADKFFEPERPAKRRRPAGRNKSSNTLYAGLAGGGLVAVGLIIGLVMLLRGGDDAPQGGQPNQVAQGGNPAAPFAPAAQPVINFNQNPNAGNAGANPANQFAPPPNFNKPPANNTAGNSSTRPGGFQTTNVPPVQVGGNAGNAGGAPGAKPAGGLQPIDDLPDIRPTSWRVQVDPPAQPFTWEPGKNVQLPVSKDFGSEVTFFPGYVPFVLLGDSKTRELWDIGKRQKIGSIKGLDISFPTFAISADGRFLSVVSKFADGVLVWHLQDGKPLGKLPLDKGAEVLAMPGTSRVVAGGGWDKPLQVWKLPSGDPERTIELPKGAQLESVCFSPGGKYMALVTVNFKDGALHLYDVASGEEVGETQVPASEKQHWLKCRGLAFSPDGTELAGNFGDGANGRIIVWGVKDGRLLDDLEYELNWHESTRASDEKTIQWFPNKQRWLVDSYVLVDRTARKPIWKFPVTNDFKAAPRGVLSDGQLLTVGGTPQKPVLIGFTLPDDLMSKAAEAVGAGGLPIDATLPKLTAANWDDAQTLSLESAAVGWRVEADPAPQAKTPIAQQPIDVSAKRGGNLLGLQLSNAAAGKAAVYYTSLPLDNTPQVGPRSRLRARRMQTQNNQVGQGKGIAWLEMVDLASGQSQKTVELDFTALLLALSPSGDRALFRLAPGEDRLDVFSTSGGSHVVGWRPFQAEKDENHRKIAAATFVDNDHVLTLSNAKKLALWKLPECRAVYQIEKVEKPGLSPNGRYLVISDEKALKFFDSRTGEPQGQLQLEGPIGAVAFHPDGNRLAVTVFNNGNMKLMVWNLQEGQQTHDFPIPAERPTSNPFGPAEIEPLHWCGDDHLLLDGTQLISLPNRMVVWKYQIANGVQSPVSPDARHWYLAAKSSGTSGSYLVAAELPEPKVQEKLAGKTLQPEFVLQPGGTFSASFNVQNPPDKPTFQADAFKAIVDRLARSNVRPQAGAPVTLVCSMSQASDGKNVEVSVGGFGRPGREEVSYPAQRIDCTAQWVHNGKVVWEQKSSSSNRILFDFLPQGKSVEQHANERMWSGAASFFMNLTPPAYVFTEGAADGLGSSQLSAEGAGVLNSRL